MKWKFARYALGALALLAPAWSLSIETPSSNNTPLVADPPLVVSIWDFLGDHPMTDRFSYPLPYIEPESAGKNEVAYNKGSNVTIRFTVDNPGQTKPGSIQFFNPTFVHFSGDPLKSVALGGGGVYNFTVPGNSSITVDVTLTGLPNHVTKGYITANVSVPGDPTWTPNVGSSSAPEDAIASIWLTYSTPVQLQSTVWKDVLDFSCEFADGTDNQQAARISNTLRLNDYPSLFYNPSQSPYASFSQFLPSALIENLTMNPTVEVDCWAMSSFLHILFSSQGIESKLEQYHSGIQNIAIDPPIYPILFSTHMVRGPGHVFQSYQFAYHQVVTSPIDASVWDPTLDHLVDLYGALFVQPPQGWDYEDYWQKWVGVYSYGLMSHFQGESPSMSHPHDGEYGAYSPIYPWSVSPPQYRDLILTGLL